MKTAFTIITKKASQNLDFLSRDSQNLDSEVLSKE